MIVQNRNNVNSVTITTDYETKRLIKLWALEHDLNLREAVYVITRLALDDEKPEREEDLIKEARTKQRMI